MPGEVSQLSNRISNLPRFDATRDNFQGLLRSLLETVQYHVPYDYGTIMLITPEGRLVEVAAHLTDGACPKPLEVHQHGVEVGLVGHVFRNRQSARLIDVHEPGGLPYHEGWADVCSEIAVPIALDDEPLGVLNLESTECGAFSEEHERLLNEVAPQVALRIARARDAEAQHRLQAVADFHTKLLEQGHQPGLFQVFANQICQLLVHAQVFCVWLADTEHNVLHAVGATLSKNDEADERSMVGQMISLERSLTGECVSTSVPVTRYNLEAAGKTVRAEFFKDKPAQGMLAVPIPSPFPEAPVGAVSIYTNDVLCRFGSDDIALVTDLCRFFSLALGRHLIASELSAQQEVAELCRHDPLGAATLDAVSRWTAKTLSANGASLFLADPDARQLRLGGTTGIDGVTGHSDYGRVTYDYGDGLTGAVAANRRPIRVLISAKGAMFSGTSCHATWKGKFPERCVAHEPGKRPYIAFPIVARDQIIGVIRVTAKVDGHFTPIDQRILGAIAGQLSIPLGVAIESRVREQKLEETQRRLIEIFKLVSTPDWYQRREEVPRQVVLGLMAALGADNASIAFYRPAKHDLDFHVFEPAEFQDTARRNPRPADMSSLVGEAFTRQRVVYEPDMKRPGCKARPVHPAARASLIAPLTAGTRKFGVLACDKRTPGSFTDEDQQTLLCFAQVAAVFLYAGEILRENDDLMNNIAHQVIAPLNEIRTIAELWGAEQREARVSETVQDRLWTVSAFAELVWCIANGFDLVDLGPADLRERIQRELRPTNLYSTLDRAVKLFRDHARMSEKEVILAPPDRSQIVWAVADRRLLPQVFVNLLDNALKYSVEKSSIRVEVREVGTKSCQVAFVNDGLPIRPHEISRVFDRGYRCEQARLFVEQGSGIGLAVARAIVRAHGGDLTVEVVPSPEYKRADRITFLVRLPLAPPARP